MKNKLSVLNIFYSFAYFLLLFIFVSILINVIGWVINIPITKFHFPISYIITLFLNYLIQKKYKNITKKDYIASMLIAFIIMCFSLFISNLFMDISYDGAWYHMTAIISMKDGWNPIYELINSGYFGDVFIDSYASKGIWSFGASVYAFFDNINSTKIISTLLAFSAIGFSTCIFGNYAKNKIEFLFIIICSILIGFNPIYISQMFTNYIDSSLGLVLTIYILIFGSMLLKQTNFEKKDFCILIIICIALMVNIKLTGLYFAALFFFSLIFIELILILKNKNFSYLYKIFITGFLGLLFALFIGVNPFITNINRGHNFFFPILGKDKIDVMGANVPEILRNKTNIEKLITANFILPLNNAKIDEITFADPFNIGLETYEGMRQDTRLGSFGSAFALIIIIMIFSLIIFSKDILKKEKNLKNTQMKFALFYMVFMILLNALIFSESWWGRYYMILWIIPIFIVIYYFFKKNLCYKIISIIIVIIMCYNLYGVYSSIYDYNMSYSKVNMDYIDGLNDKRIIYYVAGMNGMWNFYLDEYFEKNNVDATNINNSIYDWDFNNYNIYIKILE